MKCRLHYVLITYLCRSKYTPHTRTHTHTGCTHSPSPAHITSMQRAIKCIAYFAATQRQISQAHVQFASLVPSCSYFLMPHISLSLSPIYLALDGWELPAQLSLLGALVLAILFAVRCFRLSSHFGLPAIDLHSVNMLPPLPLSLSLLLSRTNSISSQLTV